MELTYSEKRLIITDAYNLLEYDMASISPQAVTKVFGFDKKEAYLHHLQDLDRLGRAVDTSPLGDGAVYWVEDNVLSVRYRGKTRTTHSSEHGPNNAGIARMLVSEMK